MRNAIASAARANISEFCTQELANTAWAVATFSCYEGPLLDCMKYCMAWFTKSSSSGEFLPQHLSNTAWAFSTRLYSHPPLFTAIAAAAMKPLRFSSQFGPQELANTSWAFASLQ